MKLFFAPGTCSLSCKILLLEAGAKFELEKVDIRAKKYSGGDFRQVNPKGSVPVLQLDNGEILTEGAVIAQYIASTNPEAGLMPKAGSMDYFRAQEWLNYVSSEVHKSFSVLFGADRMVADSTGNQQLKAAMKEAIGVKLGYLSERLKDKTFLMGEQFTAPDAYLYTCLRWSPHFAIDLAQWPVIHKFMTSVAGRPSVQEAVTSEGGKI